MAGLTPLERASWPIMLCHVGSIRQKVPRIQSLWRTCARSDQNHPRPVSPRATPLYPCEPGSTEIPVVISLLVFTCWCCTRRGYQLYKYLLTWCLSPLSSTQPEGEATRIALPCSTSLKSVPLVSKPFHFELPCFEEEMHAKPGQVV